MRFNSKSTRINMQTIILKSWKKLEFNGEPLVVAVVYEQVEENNIVVTKPHSITIEEFNNQDFDGIEKRLWIKAFYLQLLCNSDENYIDVEEIAHIYNG